ncbi:CoA-binding protein [Bacillus pinisoli]|uniref:CoA-binding protein n=1 Tax=Bacillus pinisoli TaxID=2901866 RepID=UPI001FF36643|nr:CoA-binding protein [Bacillus pinisoli]
MTFSNPSRDEIGAILKKSKRIAVIGLSDDPSTSSYMISEAMQREGYEIIPVNPNVKEVLGIQAVDSIKEIEGHIDIVNIFRRPQYLLGHAEEFLEIDADVYWTQLGLESEEAYELLRNSGKSVIMNRCIKVEHALTK